ncbi:MAG: PD-(D/E)XK nuclease family protein, partial [Clostridia bacterium]
MAFRVLTARPRRLLPHVLREMGEALHALDDAGSRLLMMVPEQMTLQAELLLCDALHLPGFFQIEVLSPSRFQDRVFSLAGSAQRVQIDTRGKQMALYEIVKCQKESLVYYAGSVGRCGFVEKLTLLLAEIKRAGLSQEALWKLSNEMTDPALQAKLKDIGQLYQIYTERLTNQFVDDEDVQAELLKRIPQSGLLAGARVWVYGFDLISAQFARQLCCMANCAQDITVTLTLDGPSARDATLYMPVRQSLARLARLLDDQRTQWCQEALDEPLPTISPIRHLEQELFAYPVRTYDTATRALSLHAAVDPYEEAMQAAAFLRDCARLDIPFAEMIVVLGDIESDGDLVAQALKRCDIPAYLDRKRSAATHPLIQALLAALRLIGRGWQTEDMSDWLKSGLCGLLEDDAAMLENYMLAHGIRGKRWFVPFVRGDAEAIVQMDVLRLQLIAPLRIFQRRLRIATDANASIHAVFQFLQEIHAYERLNEWQTNLETLQHPMEASDCSQIWRILLETLNQLHALLCGRRLPAERMAEMLEAGLSGIELGSLPPASQIVQIGQLGRAKISDCEVLVLLGMHDGVLHPATNGLLADEELMQAEQAAGVTLGLRGDALAQVAQINLLETLAAPRRRLRISYALSDASGAAQRPSSIFAQIRRIFPQLPMQGGVLGMQDSVSLPVELHAPGMALDTMGLQLRQTDGKLPPLYAHAMQWMMSHPDFHQSMQAILRASRTQIVAGPLSPMLSRKLYARARQSVTRLETFAACPYRQYIAYGLRPRKREVFEVAAQDTGLFYHQVMEMFLRAAGRHANWPNVTRTACDALCDEAIEPITQAWEEGPLGDDARNKSVGRRFCRIARRAAWT